METTYKRALEQAEKEIGDLLAEHAKIERRVGQLKATVTVLKGLLEEPPKAEDQLEIGDIGITEAIRQILREHSRKLTGMVGGGLSPAQIKERLVDAKFDLSKYANSSAVIHNTLRRLMDQKEIVIVVGDGGTSYALARNPTNDYAAMVELMKWSSGDTAYKYIQELMKGSAAAQDVLKVSIDPTAANAMKKLIGGGGSSK